ncbi:hypothetical protein SteCoe_21015 [Stentor coeruleus]|uniref:Dickkopf N-terminal cysteine-rich domain-containing protein n=1 Tax=Stentor coeruleus TaxID=5963 RepID=A0A1R2BQF7_9CILI|nr:hypothetical protein SteCoe_21015 [Stentor coeruleus]
MEKVLLLALLAVSCFGFQDFHTSYIQRFTRAHKEPSKATYCEPYLCSPKALIPNQCVYPVDGNNYLQTCPSGSFCPWALSSPFNASCVQGSTALSYGGLPGDACKSKADCQGLSVCNQVTGVCEGGKTGAFCNDQPDCDVGFNCHNVEQAASCQPVNNLGGTCGNYLTMNLCKNTLTCNYGKCINLFSLQDGTLVENDSAALACQSGFYELTQQPGQAVCKSAPKSPKVAMPISCSAGTMCKSSDNKYQTPCQCGFNSMGQGYCPLFPGDDLYQQYLTALKKYMTYPGLNDCHYLDVGMPTCSGVPKPIYEEVEATATEVEFYVAKFGNDRCVKNIITSSYWY